MSKDAQSLEDRVLAELLRHPGMKARDVAERLGADRRDVLRCLAYELAGKVRQAADYTWWPRETARPATAGPWPAVAEPAPAGTTPGPAVAPTAPGTPPANTEIARLCRYYLECIGQDMDEGASAFAANRYGEPDYAELPSLPIAHAAEDWFNAPGVSRVLGKVRKERGRLMAWLGYPVRLRRHRTARWEGFFVEPVLLWRIELGEHAGEPPRIEDDAPQVNAKFMRGVSLGGGLQLVDEMARLIDELGLNAPLADLPEADEIVERLARIRPDWGWKEDLDPTACGGDASLARINEQGIYNRAIVLPGERSPFTQGLENELKALAGAPEDVLRGTALGRWLEGVVEPGELAEDPEPLFEVLPMNTEQRTAVRTALSAPHTVITGPPGTGKSQVVTNLVVNAAWRGNVEGHESLHFVGGPVPIDVQPSIYGCAIRRAQRDHDPSAVFFRFMARGLLAARGAADLWRSTTRRDLAFLDSNESRKGLHRIRASPD